MGFIRTYLERRVSLLRQALEEAEQALADLDAIDRPARATSSPPACVAPPHRSTGRGYVALRAAVLAIITREQPVSLAEIRDELPADVPTAQIKAAVKRLHENGQIQREGQTLAARWSLVGANRPHTATGACTSPAADAGDPESHSDSQAAADTSRDESTAFARVASPA